MPNQAIANTFQKLSGFFAASAPSPRGDEIPGFRHRTSEPQYARLALPFCRKDSIRKLAVLLDEEVAKTPVSDDRA